MKLANKKPLKFNGKIHDELVNNENVIMLYNVDFNGKVTFELAEIINAKRGTYKMLRNGEIRQGYPFEGYNYDKNYQHESISYSEYGSGRQIIAREGYDFAEIDREDNIVFVPLGIMFTDREDRMYKVKDYFHLLGDDPNIYKCCHIELGNDPNNRRKFNAAFVDRFGLFSKPQSPKSEWVQGFLQDINEIYERFTTENKWYSKKDEQIVLQEEKKEKEKVDAWVKSTLSKNYESS